MSKIQTIVKSLRLCALPSCVISVLQVQNTANVRSTVIR